MAKKETAAKKTKQRRREEPVLVESPRDRVVRRLRTAGHVALQMLLATIVFFQLNYLSCRRYQTIDLSQNRKFSLSDTTVSFLENIGTEVDIIMAFLGTAELYSDVKGLVSEYDRAGGDRIRAEYLDLSRSRERIAELKDKYKLEFSRNQIIILAKNGRIKTIGEEELVTRDASSGRVIEFSGEEILTSSLLEVTEQQQRKVYLVTGDRRADELVRIAAQLQPLANAQNAQLEGLVLEGIQSIPDDADALIFLGNSEDISERELQMVRSYWEERKGGLVVFLDPASETPNLNSLLREHGVGPNDDRVLSVISIPGVAERKATDVPVTLVPGNGPTKDLPALTMQLTGRTQSLAVLFEDELLLSENIRPMPLMVAGNGFWGETDYLAEEVGYNPDHDNGRPDPVFTAASVEKGELGDANLQETTSRLVVVGNPDVISATAGTSKVGADFTMAAINWVMNREELVGIMPKQPTAFTLNISPADFGLLQSVMIFILPLGALLFGGFVWMRRRT